jgi:hypothetical protein
VFTQFGRWFASPAERQHDDANSRFLGSGFALARLIAEQGHAAPGAVGGNVAESVTRKVRVPLAGQGESGGQLADGVGGLGTATVAAEGDDQAAGLEDVDVRPPVGGVGVSAAADMPGADADAR